MDHRASDPHRRQYQAITAYEATLRVAAEQGPRGGRRTVLLTRLGGGAFGNAGAWIDDAIVRGLERVGNEGQDVRLVSHGVVHPALRPIESDRRARAGSAQAGLASSSCTLNTSARHAA